MARAEAELGKKIRELEADDALLRSLRFALSMEAISVRPLSLSGPLADSGPAAGPSLLSKRLTTPTDLIGKLEADRLRDRNPEIVKYFEGVKTDPAYDRKGRSFEIAPTYASGDAGGITPWCAAFVNWCLAREGAAHLGIATAKSWLDFGTPILDPVYGCVTIVKPSSSTGSTTGHVAFYVATEGDYIVLLGGNQGDQVSKSKFKSRSVLGHRWPTTINHYWLASGGVLA